MKCVVTGGAGFIGSNLVDRLLADGNEVSVIDNYSSGKKENCNKNAIYHDIDLSDTKKKSDIKNVLQSTEIVFHCAALARVQPSILDPIKYEVNNTIGTINMLKCAVDMEVRRVVYSASSSVYGPTKKLPSKESDSPNPISPYANQKYYGELYCKMFSTLYPIETVSLRYFNVFGERQNLKGAYATVVGIFINQMLNNQCLTINGNGKQRRDFTHVKDVVSANILAANSRKVGKGEVINIGSGTNVSINTLADSFGGTKKYLDAICEPFANLADIKKAKKLLDWEPSMCILDWIKEYKLLNGMK
jgi:UDP-glucose 4-epimerase